MERPHRILSFAPKLSSREKKENVGNFQANIPRIRSLSALHCGVMLKLWMRSSLN